ncbi:MAG TPA: Wzz/FepE/Etk N-terminal domain-containing protein [Verrucomicrobiae bacterium]|nr:Wzz/FepE/Etk N-terminal domain-containing protein [Verrucomicrobiae bacterium]
METRRPIILGFLLLLTGLALCAGGLWFLLSPAQYTATVQIKINPDINDIPSNGSGNSATYDPYFIQTEFEIIQSDIVLGNAIKTLNLHVSVYSLKRQINVRSVRNKRLVEICVTDRNPDTAAKIANTIASAFRDYKIQLWQSEFQNGIKTMEEECQIQEQKVKTMQAKVEQLRQNLNVPSPEPSEEQLKSNYPAYFQARKELNASNEFIKIFREKIDAEKMDHEIPREIIEIVNSATSQTQPTGPDRSLGVLFIIGLFPVIGGLLFLKSSFSQTA